MGEQDGAPAGCRAGGDGGTDVRGRGRAEGTAARGYGEGPRALAGGTARRGEAELRRRGRLGAGRRTQKPGRLRTSRKTGAARGRAGKRGVRTAWGTAFACVRRWRRGCWQRAPRRSRRAEWASLPRPGAARWDKAAVLGCGPGRPARGGRRTSGLSLAGRGEGAACLRGRGRGGPTDTARSPRGQLREGG